MYADDDRDRNRDPQSKSATRQQRRAERDQSGFDSKNDSEQYADALSLPLRLDRRRWGFSLRPEAA